MTGETALMGSTLKPTRRDERRAQTIREIKELAMEQVREGGPDAVSLSGIVRSMSMSPAAVYRYFENRDALLADLVVDSYNALADSLVAIDEKSGSPDDYLVAVLRGSRTWAVQHPNAYRLIFQTTIGSGLDLAADRTISASSHSMAVIVRALAGAASGTDSTAAPGTPESSALVEAITQWAVRSELTAFSPDVLTLAFLTWTRLHGIISLELGGHLTATGIGASDLFEAEVRTIRARAAELPRQGGTHAPSIRH